jgi:hypothetical protein
MNGNIITVSILESKGLVFELAYLVGYFFSFLLVGFFAFKVLFTCLSLFYVG